MITIRSNWLSLRPAPKRDLARDLTLAGDVRHSVEAVCHVGLAPLAGTRRVSAAHAGRFDHELCRAPWHLDQKMHARVGFPWSHNTISQPTRMTAAMTGS